MVKKTKKAKSQPMHRIDCDLDEDCSCSPKLEELQRLLSLCRSFGVLSFKHGSLEFQLAPVLATDPPLVAPSEPQVPVQQSPEMTREKKRGADGLTAEQQEELLGRPMDAER